MTKCSLNCGKRKQNKMCQKNLNVIKWRAMYKESFELYQTEGKAEFTKIDWGV